MIPVSPLLLRYFNPSPCCPVKELALFPLNLTASLSEFELCALILGRHLSVFFEFILDECKCKKKSSCLSSTLKTANCLISEHAVCSTSLVFDYLNWQKLPGFPQAADLIFWNLAKDVRGWVEIPPSLNGIKVPWAASYWCLTGVMAILFLKWYPWRLALKVILSNPKEFYFGLGKKRGTARMNEP